ncbi:MAG: hypothetical protein HY731_07255 [Candidatus Tectomicrobia bacterium]|nr:hypothetical protein [Candidatus Tectomicrobia bacterium]
MRQRTLSSLIVWLLALLWSSVDSSAVSLTNGEVPVNKTIKEGGWEVTILSYQNTGQRTMLDYSEGSGTPRAIEVQNPKETFWIVKVNVVNRGDPDRLFNYNWITLGGKGVKEPFIVGHFDPFSREEKRFLALTAETRITPGVNDTISLVFIAPSGVKNLALHLLDSPLLLLNASSGKGRKGQEEKGKAQIPKNRGQKVKVKK